VRGLLLLLVLSWPLVALAQPWVEGTHYERVPGTHEPREDGRIEVAEAFWYACPSCYNFEPHLLRWLETKPDDVAFVRIPASLNPAWRVHSRAFHTAEALGVLDTMHGRIFRTIHMERNALSSVEALSELFTAHTDVDAEAFRTTYQSFAVETRMRQGDALIRGYRVSAVPTVIVNRRYRSNPGMTRGYAQLIQLIDHLVELERQAAENPE
jgi:protein dithiol oxidoreductase (disulfide-forming)